MLAIGRIALMSGELGHLNGLPVSVIIRTTLQDLESRAGIGVTGGGTKLPIADVITMAAHARRLAMEIPIEPDGAAYERRSTQSSDNFQVVAHPLVTFPTAPPNRVLQSFHFRDCAAARISGVVPK